MDVVRRGSVRLRLGMLTIAGAATVVVAAPAAAQDDKPRHRWEYFYRMRAYPFDSLPRGAFRTARQQVFARWGNPARAVAPAPSLATGSWTSIGPQGINPTIGFPYTASGRISAVAIHPTNYSIIYVGGAQGGVWKSTNSGVNWSPLTDTECSLAMGSIAVDPTDPDNIVYAGTGEQHFSGDSYYGCGVLRTDNGGTTWTQLGASIFDPAGGAGAQVSRIVVDPEGAGTTTSSHVIVASNFGLHRSTNSGGTWTDVEPANWIWTDLVIDPANDDVWYAAGFGGGTGGVWKSTNDGVTWTQLAGGLPTTNIFRVNLAIAPSASSTVYAAFTEATTFSELEGLYVTTDGGTNWTQTATTPACGQCFYDLTLAVDPADANHVFFGGVDFFHSTNAGGTFSAISQFPFGQLHADQHIMVFDPTNANRALIGNDGGIFKSLDGGTTWNDFNTDLAITQFYAGISLHPTDPAVVLGGTQDNGTLLTTGSLTWSDLIGGDGGFTAIDFNNPSTMYGETQWSSDPAGLFHGPRRSDNSGASFPRKVTGINLGDAAQFIPPLVMDPSDPTILYFGTFRLYQTKNRGDSWTAISGDLTKGGAPGGGFTSSAISAIASAPSNPDVIYVGLGDGNVHVTQNDGTSFTQIITGLPNRAVTDLAVHPTDDQTAYVTFSGFGTGHVFKTTNAGGLWTDISSNLPDLPVNAVLIEPGSPGTLYLGTDLGVYVSTNDGVSWAPFNTGLPLVAVFDLAANANTGIIVAATHGRGMFSINFNVPLALDVTPEGRKATVDEGSTTLIPDDATVTISGTNSASANWSAVALGGEPWLSFTTAAGTGDGMVTWSRDPTGLAAGTYTETISVSVAGAVGSPATIEDTLVVNPSVTLTVDPETRADTALIGSTVAIPDSATVTLTGTGSQATAWVLTHTAAATWNTLTTAGGTGDGQARWSRDPTGLAIGVYVDTLVVNAAGAAGSPDSIIDTLLVTAPTLSVLPLAHLAEVETGSTAPVPDSSDVVLTGPGADTFGWTATNTAAAAWNTLTTAAGTGTGLVRWTRDPTGLADGVYVDTITVDAPGATGSPRMIIDSLRVTSPLEMTVAPAGRSATADSGATGLLTDSAAVSFTGVGAADAPWTAENLGEPWMTLTTAAGTGDGYVRWSRDPSGLGEGVFVDTIFVMADGAIGSPATVVDTLTIAVPLAVTVDPTSRTDSAIAGIGTVSVDSASVTVTGTGNATAAWSATHGGGGWIALLTPNGTGTGYVKWNRDPSGLSEGTHVDTITVTLDAGASATIVDRFEVAAPVSLTDAANQLLLGTGLSPFEIAVLDALGNQDGVFNLGDVLAWIDRCQGSEPGGCVVTGTSPPPTAPPDSGTARRRPL